MSAAYVYTSALVKLFKSKRETEAFRAALADWPVQVASEIIRVEAICTARRLGDEHVLRRAAAALERTSLIPLTSEIIEPASDAHAPPLRAMNAIHLGTALSMREDLGAIFVYDSDLLAAAKVRGLNPLAPAT